MSGEHQDKRIQLERNQKKEDCGKVVPNGIFFCVDPCKLYVMLLEEGDGDSNEGMLRDVIF